MNNIGMREAGRLLFPDPVAGSRQVSLYRSDPLARLMTGADEIKAYKNAVGMLFSLFSAYLCIRECMPLDE
jgi:hypothetical protein